MKNIVIAACVGIFTLGCLGLTVIIAILYPPKDKDE